MHQKIIHLLQLSTYLASFSFKITLNVMKQAKYAEPNVKQVKCPIMTVVTRLK